MHSFHAPRPHYCQTVEAPWWKALLIGLFWIAFFLGAMIAVICAGCQDATVKAAIQDSQHKAAIQVAQMKSAAKVKNAKVNASPVAHPVAAGTQVVKRVREPLIPSTVISFLAFAVAVGLYLQKVWFAKTAMSVAGCTSALSFIGAIALPWLPWVFAALVSLSVILFLWEWHKTGSVEGAITFFEDELSKAGTPSAPLEVTPPPPAPAK